jgi:hypothetical protein
MGFYRIRISRIALILEMIVGSYRNRFYWKVLCLKSQLLIKRFSEARFQGSDKLTFRMTVFRALPQVPRALSIIIDILIVPATSSPEI